MKRSFLVIILLAFSFITPSAASNVTQALGKIPLFYAITAEHSTLKLISKQDKQYLLTLYPVEPAITYFSNRPYKLAGKMSLQSFVKEWKVGPDSFAKTPPNAALTGVVSAGKSAVDYIFVLQNITYNAKDKSLQFLVKPLLLDQKNKPEEKLNFTSLFIDFHWHNNIP